MKKLLIYGGAFNPPHLGHAHLLRAAIQAVQPNLTLVIPSAISPHKTAAAVSLNLRAQMCRFFKNCGENVRVSEIEHAGRHDKSYTVKTLRRLKRIYPHYAFYLLVGGDMLLSFERWRHWRRILGMATLVAAAREPRERRALEQKREALERAGGRVLLLDVQPLPMSSSEIRETLRRGGSVEELLDPSVCAVIDKNRLYRQ